MRNSKIGITTTVPVEVIYAADLLPLDLNNAFITSENPEALLQNAEKNGFPSSCCAWIKGLYSTVHACNIETIIAVTSDCSETTALAEILASEGKTIIPFAYPYSPDPEKIKAEINKLCTKIGTSLEKAEKTKQRLDQVRKIAHNLDKLSYTENQLTGRELFETLVNCSDFAGNPEKYGEKLQNLQKIASKRDLETPSLRLGIAGVPPIFTNLFEILDERKARAIFTEIPRQFTLPFPEKNFYQSYSSYTYPYSIQQRLLDLQQQIKIRQIDGLIHYVQSFCHRQIYDRLLRENLNLPILCLEADRPGPVDARSITRIEAFLELLEARK